MRTHPGPCLDKVQRFRDVVLSRPPRAGRQLDAEARVLAGTDAELVEPLSAPGPTSFTDMGPCWGHPLLPMQVTKVVMGQPNAALGPQPWC